MQLVGFPATFRSLAHKQLEAHSYSGQLTYRDHISLHKDYYRRLYDIITLRYDCVIATTTVRHKDQE